MVNDLLRGDAPTTQLGLVRLPEVAFGRIQSQLGTHLAYEMVMPTGGPRVRANIPAALFALIAVLCLPADPAGAQTAAPVWTRRAASEVQIHGVAAVIHVTPEDRGDIAVSISNAGRLPAPDVRLSRGKLMIDGGLDRQIQGCRTRGGFEAHVRRYGWIAAADLPVINLRVPEDAVISAGGAISAHVGPSENLELFLDGCGSADVERVDESANVALAGGDMALRLYDAGEAAVRIAGGGDVNIGVVRDGLELSIAGSGDVEVGRADGPTNIAIQGSGDVAIRDGRATVLSVVIAGSGDVNHQGEADSLDVAIVGAGDVHVARVRGEVTRHIIGAGSVTVGN
jgi:hypothetical protein